MAEIIKKNLKNIKRSELSVIFNKFIENGSVFRFNFSQISKNLLKEFLNVNPFSINFEILKTAYLEHIEFNTEEILDDLSELNKLVKEKIKEEIVNAIKDETSFHKYICKSFFNLIKEPKEELLEVFIIASQDIKDIDETLSDIQLELNKVYDLKLSGELQEKEPILLYFKKRNEKAKNEILNFIKDEIKNYALNNCYDNYAFESLKLKIPYSYRWNPKSYKPHYPNDLENKFGELLYQDFLNLYKQYEDDKPSFYSFLSNYIIQKDIVPCIIELLDIHHILNIRKEIIEDALKTYQQGSKIMFTNATPSIIEGILHDLCLLIGENDNILLQKGFQYKLDRLQNTFGSELYYEYYSFRFRLIRNKVAHGRLTKVDVDELADLLLLDLYQVCKLVKSEKLSMNHKRFVIDELNKNISKPNFKYLIEYLLLNNIVIPPFYKLDKQIEEIEKLISNDTFWEFLEQEMDKGGEPVKHGIFTVLKVICARKPFDKRCTKLFKKSGISNVDKELANYYLKYLTKDF